MLFVKYIIMVSKNDAKNEGLLDPDAGPGRGYFNI
jgi:hypothetical protein